MITNQYKQRVVSSDLTLKLQSTSTETVSKEYMRVLCQAKVFDWKLHLRHSQTEGFFVNSLTRNAFDSFIRLSDFELLSIYEMRREFILDSLIKNVYVT